MLLCHMFCMMSNCFQIRSCNDLGNMDYTKFAPQDLDKSLLDKYYSLTLDEPQVRICLQNNCGRKSVPC